MLSYYDGARVFSIQRMKQGSCKRQDNSLTQSTAIKRPCQRLTKELTSQLYFSHLTQRSDSRLNMKFLHPLPEEYLITARIRRMGKVMFSVCPHLGGVPISHNALQHFPECHEAASGGVPISHNALQHFPECHEAATREGVPARSSRGGVPCQGGYPTGGGTQVRYPPWGGTLLGRVPRSGTPPGGILPGGYPGHGTPPGGYPGQDNIGSTCYTAGGMPFAFTQEDFLVL